MFIGGHSSLEIASADICGACTSRSKQINENSWLVTVILICWPVIQRKAESQRQKALGDQLRIKNAKRCRCMSERVCVCVTSVKNKACNQQERGSLCSPLGYLFRLQRLAATTSDLHQKRYRRTCTAARLELVTADNRVADRAPHFPATFFSSFFINFHLYVTRRPNLGISYICVYFLIFF